MALEMKKALITASGIMVDENVFTCSLAIREQWFIKVLDTGPIEVDFYVNSGNLNEGVISLSVGYEGCLRVEHAIISEELRAEYFERLEIMKNAFNRKKKNQ